MKIKYTIYLTLLVLQLIFLINIQFTLWPEMLSFPYLVRNNFNLYSDFVQPYPPALTWILSVSPFSIQFFNTALVLVNNIFIFLITNSLISVLAYSVLQPVLEGNMLWPDTAIVTPLLVSIYYLLKSKYKYKIYISSLFFIIAVFIKQTAGLFLIAYVYYFINHNKSLENLKKFLLVPISLGLILLIYLLINNNFVDFYLWNIWFPFFKWSSFPGYVDFALNKRQILIMLLLSVPAIYLICIKSTKYYYFVLFYLLSLLAIYPRFSFFHFQMGIVIFAILLSKVKNFYLSLAIIFLLLFLNIPIYKYNWGKETRFNEKTDFKYLNSGDIVYFLNLHSANYVYTKTFPPKPWIDNFGWYWQMPGVTEKTISKWEQNPPKYIVRQIPEEGQWYELGTYEPEELIVFMERDYEQIDVINEIIQIWQKKD